MLISSNRNNPYSFMVYYYLFGVFFLSKLLQVSFNFKGNSVGDENDS